MASIVLFRNNSEKNVGQKIFCKVFVEYNAPFPSCEIEVRKTLRAVRPKGADGGDVEVGLVAKVGTGRAKEFGLVF